MTVAGGVILVLLSGEWGKIKVGVGSELLRRRLQGGRRGFFAGDWILFRFSGEWGFEKVATAGDNCGLEIELIGSEIVRRRLVVRSWILVKPSRRWPVTAAEEEGGGGERVGFLGMGCSWRDEDEKSDLLFEDPQLLHCSMVVGFTAVVWWLPAAEVVVKKTPPSFSIS